MNLRGPKKRVTPEVNLTSMIDVLFLLILFFMVSTTFDRFGRVRVELPDAQAQAESRREPDRIDVVVDTEGQVFVGDRELVNTDIETVKRGLLEVAGERRDLPVVIAADARAPHGAVIKVMDAASQVGLVQIAFAVRAPAPQP
ncbi:MAG: biopolymer transporter ExbD [Gammaproteobacteria bacterium]|jgi:biopolymer transport protein ExbD|nr:biopolymer transporter ExbD [Gammaproteobacteria bacterium]